MIKFNRISLHEIHPPRHTTPSVVQNTTRCRLGLAPCARSDELAKNTHSHRHLHMCVWTTMSSAHPASLPQKTDTTQPNKLHHRLSWSRLKMRAWLCPSVPMHSKLVRNVTSGPQAAPSARICHLGRPQSSFSVTRGKVAAFRAPTKFAA